MCERGAGAGALEPISFHNPIALPGLDVGRFARSDNDDTALSLPLGKYSAILAIYLAAKQPHMQLWLL